MALIPSLSLWSSIKIPFPLYSKKKITPSVPYVDSCKLLKQSNYSTEAEPAREVVNLRVPTPLSKKEESSNSLPHLRVLSISHKKRTHPRCSSKSKTKQIGYVIVPGGASLDNGTDWEETFSTNQEKAILDSKRSTGKRLGEDLYDKCPEFNFEEVCGDCDYVPSVQPWVQELDETNGKQERRSLKMTDDKREKNKQKGNVSIHNNKNMDKTSGSLNGKEFNIFQKQLYGDLCKNPSKELQRLTAKMKGTSTDADYYERKLAELYTIELGLKI